MDAMERIKAALPAARARAAAVGPLHGLWDAIFDGEALIKGERTVIDDPETIATLLEKE